MIKECILRLLIGYVFFQHLCGADKMRTIMSHQYIRPEKGQRILDVACGTADIRSYIMDSSYTGIDLDATYIQFCKKKYGKLKNTRFVCVDLNEYVATTKEKYDVILLSGVLHHIDDKAVKKCLKALPSLLNSGGQVITMDGVYTDDLNFFERFLLQSDRGKYVRTLRHWEQLFNDCLPGSEYQIRKDLYRLPFNQILFHYCKS